MRGVTPSGGGADTGGRAKRAGNPNRRVTATGYPPR